MLKQFQYFSSTLKLPAIGLLLSSGALIADVKLPAIFSDHMVLKADANVPLWGKADPGEEVTVSMNGQTVKATAGNDGKWKVLLNLKDSPPGPFDLTVNGKNTLKISDVVVGEVWLGAGQSNMYWKMNIGPYTTEGGAEEVARSANPMLRIFEVQIIGTEQPQDDCKGSWVVAGPTTTQLFSAVGYYFAKKLQNELKVPVGLVVSSVGGTQIEAWTSEDAPDTNAEALATKKRLWKNFANYADNRQKFLTGFPAWLKAHDREDKPTPDAQAYAAPGISTVGWVPIKQLPGLVTGTGLPVNGAIWLRHEYNVPEAKLADQRTNDYAIQIDLGPMTGFESIYWNGQLMSQPTLDKFGGEGSHHSILLPIKLVKEGSNTLAVRIFSPVDPFNFPSTPIVTFYGGMTDQWLAKAEYALPPLDAATLASVPQPASSVPETSIMPGFLFNAMINPLIPYAFSGIVWYQGESNGDSYEYRDSFALMIGDWRQHWGNPDLPFYFCQLACYGPKMPNPGESAWAELRESQGTALKLPHTGQAVLIDLGESDNVHYYRKRPLVGERLALIALAEHYGKKIPFSGPMYSSMKVEDGKIRVQFDHVEGGLVAQPVGTTYPVNLRMGTTAPLVLNSPKSDLQGFAICGDDRKWVWADAKIDGNSVLVSSDSVPKPVAVRYAWEDFSVCNLFNAAGLPASPFRTDDFPAMTKDRKDGYPGDNGK